MTDIARGVAFTCRRGPGPRRTCFQSGSDAHLILGQALFRFMRGVVKSMSHSLAPTCCTRVPLQTRAVVAPPGTASALVVQMTQEAVAKKKTEEERRKAEEAEKERLRLVRDREYSSPPFLCCTSRDRIAAARPRVVPSAITGCRSHGGTPRAKLSLDLHRSGKPARRRGSSSRRR